MVPSVEQIHVVIFIALDMAEIRVVGVAVHLGEAVDDGAGAAARIRREIRGAPVMAHHGGSQSPTHAARLPLAPSLCHGVGDGVSEKLHIFLRGQHPLGSSVSVPADEGVGRGVRVRRVQNDLVNVDSR